MQEAVQEKPRTFSELLNNLLDFHLSDKFKFAVKTSLAIMLAYLIAFSQGWAQASTAAITIMLIALAGPVSESVLKGLKRIIGIIIGAIIGMTLIALFPQERTAYLIALSFCVTFTLYLTRAYKGDNTAFMLMSVTMMMVFKNGEVDDVFSYGIDRTYMTTVGVAIYTVIGMFIWPVKTEDDSSAAMGAQLDAQAELYKHRDDKEEIRKENSQKVQAQEKRLEQALLSSVSDTTFLSRAQKTTLLVEAKAINELLILLSYHDEANYAKGYDHYVSNFQKADEEITTLFKALKEAVESENPIEIPEKWEPDIEREHVKSLSHIERAALTATMLEIGKLHEHLRQMGVKFNAINAATPTSFTLTKEPNPSKFNWLDPEYLKGSLLTFIIFWSTTLFWIWINPPGGFLVVVLATALSVVTTFSPLKPSLLIIVFTFSFIFATVMYIFVLPHVIYGWELGLFIFFYAFIGLYFIKPMLSIFFLLGLSVLALNNPMYFNFNLFLLILLLFYLFLFILLLFYYIPFSTKPEVLFLQLKQRFFRLSANLLQETNSLVKQTETTREKISAAYSEAHLFNTVKKMQLWASKIDTQYFDKIEQKTLMAFTENCETFSYLLLMMYKRDKEMANNPLIQAFFITQKQKMLYDILREYAEGKDVSEVDAVWVDESKILETMESSLQHFLSSVKANQYTQSDIITFYENIALRRNVWMAFFKCQTLMKQLDFSTLKESRF